MAVESGRAAHDKRAWAAARRLLADAAEHQDRLTVASRIAYPSPYTLLRSPSGQAVYGNLEPLIDLPPTAPLRWT